MLTRPYLQATEALVCDFRYSSAVRADDTGATGLLKALSLDYLSTLDHEASIEWYCNHSRNTQLALLHGYIDIALTYERDQEALAVSEGWSSTVGCAFHDHFCIAGPVTDPADVSAAHSLQDALRRMAKSKAAFHSRADFSATMWKERSLWSSCNLSPWDDQDSANWYETSLRSPLDALVAADSAGAYLLTDRSTLLHQVSLGTVKQTTVFFEPTSRDDVLMNSCYVLTSPQSSTVQADAVSKFIEYLFSKRGQIVIAEFGKEEPGDCPLFAPVAEDFARISLKGGYLQGGKWMMVSK